VPGTGKRNAREDSRPPQPGYQLTRTAAEPVSVLRAACELAVEQAFSARRDRAIHEAMTRHRRTRSAIIVVRPDNR
jgi:hypothetical protein